MSSTSYMHTSKVIDIKFSISFQNSLYSNQLHMHTQLCELKNNHWLYIKDGCSFMVLKMKPVGGGWGQRTMAHLAAKWNHLCRILFESHSVTYSMHDLREHVSNRFVATITSFTSSLIVLGLVAFCICQELCTNLLTSHAITIFSYYLCSTCSP